MQRINNYYIATVEQVILLHNERVLEIGCGDGKRSVEIADRCARLVGIDPDAGKIDKARDRHIANASFALGSADKLLFENQSFNAAIFSFSFHHIPIDYFDLAIREAVRVIRPDGYIIFLELAETGSQYEAEAYFATGDDCSAKTVAYQAITSNPQLRIIADIEQRMHYQYDSADDFIINCQPSAHLDKIEDFLRRHDYQLSADRRIIVAQPN